MHNNNRIILWNEHRFFFLIFGKQELGKTNNDGKKSSVCVCVNDSVTGWCLFYFFFFENLICRPCFLFPKLDHLDTG